MFSGFLLFCSGILIYIFFMRILFCSSFIHNSRNGAAIFARLFLDWASHRKIEVDIISPEESTILEHIPFVTNQKGFRKIPILNNYHRSYIYYKTVQQQLKKKSYELIFFNSVIESLHSARLIDNIPVHAFLHDENFMNDYKIRPSLKRRIYRKFMRKQEQKACVELTKIWTNSKYMNVAIQTHYNIHPIKIANFYFRSFDLVPSFSEKKPPGLEKTILFIKHDYERGGLLSVIDAINMIDDYEIRLIVVGPAKSSHRFIRSRYDGDMIEIYEYKNRAEIQTLFQTADIFCVPSFSEALGLGNLEAMVFEIPVISSNIPVMQELNTRNCMLLCDPYNPNSIAQAIRSTFTDVAIIENRVNNGKRFVEEEIAKVEVFNSLDNIVASL